MSANLTTEDFLDLAPNSQLRYSNDIENTKEDTTSAPQSSNLHNRTHAQSDEAPSKIPSNDPATPANTHSESQRPNTFVDSAASPLLSQALNDGLGEQREHKPHYTWEKSRRAGGGHGADVESERGKLQVDTFGMADTLNDGEAAEEELREITGRSRCH
ncbi:hypothetical protein HDV00_011285 [Rhizophlyctis rosea]|nr:hypothetical protein HDV00_011285 [Rhizophlyctis rosea]